MGCHTWFSVPIIKDKDEIISRATEYLASTKSNWMDESTKRMYELAVEHELSTPCCELAYPDQSRNGEWIIYIDVEDSSLLEYNKLNGTSYESKYGLPKGVMETIESYSDEPRISGYPPNKIHSYEEMLSFMEKGYTDSKGVHHDFYYDKERYPIFMEDIKRFFGKHPDGIITFG